MTCIAPGALWLLAALPAVWIALPFGRGNFNRRQRLLQAAVRSVMLAALAVALARPVRSSASSRESIVYLVDVSHSIATRAIEAAARTIDEVNAARRPDHVAIVAFAANTVRLESTEALRQLAHEDPSRSQGSRIDRRSTDLEAALDGARAELASGHVPRIVLFTDGHPTAGDASMAVARLAAAHVPVSVHPMTVRSLGDAWVARIDVPDRITADAPFPATMVVGSQRDANLTASIRVDGVVAAEQPATVTKGTMRISLEAKIATPGAHVIEGAIRMPDDPLGVNDQFPREVWVDRRPAVLYVERVTSSARYLSGALTASGFDVSVRGAAGLPRSAADLEPYDAMVLSDVPRAAIADSSMTAIAQWVEQGGGGLLVAGGEAVFGERGYRRTTLERLTPVTFERKDEPEVALVLVLDRSLSMSGRSMDLCKVAAQAAVDVMKDDQAIGILTFNDKFDWAVTLRTIEGHRDEIRRRIAAIEPAGNTLFYPAMEQAYLALRAAKARARHIVMLSDGRSYPADYESLIEKMVDARITLSTVAIGPSANPELLRSFATWGKGRAYVSEDAKQLPQIFVTEAKNAASPSFEEKDIVPVIKAPGFLSGVDLRRVPPLKGRTATVLKDTALEVAATGDDEPLLAFWPIGLGRTAVFASDVKDRWAANWVTWRGYGPFFTSVVRAIARQRPQPLRLEVAPGPIRGGLRALTVALEARDARGAYRELLHPVVRVSSTSGTGAGRTVDAPLRQIAPGRYETHVVAPAYDRVTVRALPIAGDAPGAMNEPARIVAPDPGAEYRFTPPDERRLASIALATGGTWKPTAASLAGGAVDRRTERRPLWPAFVTLALSAWFVDIVLRRIRVFEPAVRKGDH